MASTFLQQICGIWLLFSTRGSLEIYGSVDINQSLIEMVQIEMKRATSEEQVPVSRCKYQALIDDWQCFAQNIIFHWMVQVCGRYLLVKSIHILLILLFSIHALHIWWAQIHFVTPRFFHASVRSIFWGPIKCLVILFVQILQLLCHLDFELVLGIDPVTIYFE